MELELGVVAVTGTIPGAVLVVLFTMPVFALLAKITFAIPTGFIPISDFGPAVCAFVVIPACECLSGICFDLYGYDWMSFGAWITYEEIKASACFVFLIAEPTLFRYIGSRPGE